MQKKIIALAIAAAFSAPAFADVNMYGVVDAAVAHASADGQKSDTIAVSGGLSASRIGMNASEDLSGGMKALVNIEYALDTQTSQNGGTAAAPATNVVARQQMLGLAGGFGTVATGYLQTAAFDFGMKFDPTADSLVSPLQNVTGQNFLIGSNAAAARAQRALAYISPNFSGLTVAVNYATALAGLGTLGVAANAAPGAANGKTSATLVSANYDWNALTVGGVYASTANTNTGVADLKDYALGASYDFKVVKLSGTYQSSTPTGGSANKAMSFSAVAPVGPGAILASYAKNTMALANSNATSYTVGYLQGLSKNTTAYAAVSKVTQGSATRGFSVINDALANANMTLGGSSTLLAVGLNKKF